MAHPAPDNPVERLNRVEEAAAFTDRSVELLTEQLLDLDRRMRQLASRLETIESRLSGVAAQLARTEPGSSADPADAEDDGGAPPPLA